MSELLTVFQTEIFFEGEWTIAGNHKVGQMTVLVPIDAIEYLTQSEPGNSRSEFIGHVKRNYFTNFNGRVRSINPVRLTADQVKMIK